MHQLIEDLKGLQRGRVSVYANGATVANLLAPALAEFSLRYPKLRFEVTITSARNAIEAVNSAEADIAVTLFAPPLSGTKVRLRSEIVCDVIAATGHPLATHKDVSWPNSRHISLAVPDHSFGARQAFDALFEREDWCSIRCSRPVRWRCRKSWCCAARQSPCCRR